EWRTAVGDSENYTIETTAAATADITARALTVSATGVNKVYDGTDAATVTLSDDRVAGDNLTTAYTSATFNNRNVGTTKPVSVSGISISGADSGNYTFNTTASTTADITAAGLTVNFIASDKIYDGMTTASIVGCSVTGVVSGDSVDCDASSATASFGTKNVGNGKTVTGSGFGLTGGEAPNYSITK